MTWVFLLGALYGVLLVLNIKMCKHKPLEGGISGSVSGILITTLATVLAVGKNGANLDPKYWVLPFLGICFFFMPNYIAAIGLLLDKKN